MQASRCFPVATGAGHGVAAGTIGGLGVDLCAVGRMDRWLGERNEEDLSAVFSTAEIARCRSGRHPASALAACFAAKEAVLKALSGCGAPGSYWLDIEITGTAGCARAVLSGRLADLAAAAGIREVLVAASRSCDYATAVALALT